MKLWRSFQKVVLQPGMILAVFAMGSGMAMAAERWPGFPTPIYYPAPARETSLVSRSPGGSSGDGAAVQIGPVSQAPPPGPGWKLHASGTVTNKAGAVTEFVERFRNGRGNTVTNVSVITHKAEEVLVWTEHAYIEGEVGWKRRVEYNPVDNSYKVFPMTKCDAKDLDPKYSELMAQVEKEVEAEMKRDEVAGKPGAKLHFWRLKKEKLKAQDIEWKSPAELNPEKGFD